MKRELEMERNGNGGKGNGGKGNGGMKKGKREKRKERRCGRENNSFRGNKK